MHAGVWDKSAKGSHEVRGRSSGSSATATSARSCRCWPRRSACRVYFYDTDDKLAMGNARAVRQPHRAAGDRRGGVPARRRPARQPRHVRRDRVLRHASPSDLHEPVPGLRGRPRRAAARTSSPVTSLGRPSTCSRPSPSDRATRSSRELRGLPNVILTPHIGGSTQEAQEDIGRFVAGKLRGYAQDGATSLSVNLPSIPVGDIQGSHRLAHVHRNVPGVLAKVNALFAEHGVNVDAPDPVHPRRRRLPAHGHQRRLRPRRWSSGSSRCPRPSGCGSCPDPRRPPLGGIAQRSSTAREPAVISPSAAGAAWHTGRAAVQCS